MKNISFLLILTLVCLLGCKTLKPASETKPAVTQNPAADEKIVSSGFDFSDQTSWLLGYLNPAQFIREPHSTWYVKGYDDYQLKAEVINKLLEINKEGLSIKIVMGTWCPDSRREVPRFMRILDAWKFPAAQVTFIGVDNAKLSPVGEYGKLDIQWVPTFIIYKNLIEAGRIIENPVTSLEQDIINILNKNE